MFFLALMSLFVLLPVLLVFLILMIEGIGIHDMLIVAGFIILLLLLL